MPLIYSVKIEYRNGLIVGLTSSNLKMNFIKKYLDFIDEPSLASPILPPGKLKIEHLQIVMEEYIKWIQDNNYVLRLPSQLELEHSSGCWINVPLNIYTKKGIFERSGEVVAISIYLSYFILGVFIDILAARINKLSYSALIFPVLADFLLGGILYKYSGASSNLVDKGKELDDLLSRKKFSPTEIEPEIEVTPLCSSLNLSRFILCTLALSNSIFQTLGSWQSMISMGNQFETSNLDDPIMTPELIYKVAIINAVVTFTYDEIIYTSFAIKATNSIKTLIDNCNIYCLKKVNYIMGRRHYEVFANGERAESEARSDDLYDPLAVSSSSLEMITPVKTNTNKQDITMFVITEIKYNNLLLNVQDLLFEAAKIGGAKSVQNIINLGEDYEVASTIIECIKQYGIKHVMKVLFSDTTNYKVNLSCNQIAAIAADKVTKKYSETLVPLNIEKVASKIIEQSFFLNSEQGRVFVQAVANNFDKETLLKILELGRDQEIAEQILIEVEAQGTNKVVYTLLGKESLVINAIDNLENILGTEEVNQLRIVPNGIFNAWSNKAYLKVVEYIDNLAKNLDDLLNTGKSGSQVAVTVALLEEWLGFAASGQKIIGGRPPYYNSDDNDDWPYGSGGSSDGNNNSSAGSFDNQNGFAGLILPAYNGTDYNITDYQM